MKKPTPNPTEGKAVREEETLPAKLRNQLSPIYGLAHAVLALKSHNSEELIKLVIEQAEQAISNLPVIDSLLIGIDATPSPVEPKTLAPVKSLEECKQIIAEKYGYSNWSHLRIIEYHNTKYGKQEYSDEVAELYAEQFQQAAFPFCISPKGKFYYCYKDFNGRNQHSAVFDTYDDALDDYSQLYMTQKQSSVSEWRDVSTLDFAQLCLAQFKCGNTNIEQPSIMLETLELFKANLPKPPQ